MAIQCFFLKNERMEKKVLILEHPDEDEQLAVHLSSLSQEEMNAWFKKYDVILSCSAGHFHSRTKRYYNQGILASFSNVNIVGTLWRLHATKITRTTLNDAIPQKKR